MIAADLLREAQRPLFIWGAGMRSSRDQALAIARELSIPIACTWAAIDLLDHHDPLNCGTFGTHGTRAANFAVQNADLLITLGTRLDTKSTGNPPHFARGGKICMVDIDAAEIAKFARLGRPIDVACHSYADKFLTELASAGLTKSVNYWPWIARIHRWRAQYEPKGQAYDLMRAIAEHTNAQDTIVSNTGNTLGWIMQGFPFKGERFIHAFNFTPMGYGLGAAIGAAFATGGRVVCIVGDGGALMGINELATIKRHNLPVVIILLNNGQHSMCVRTENQWFEGKNCATTVESGLGFPDDWNALAAAFGIHVSSDLQNAFYATGPTFHEVIIGKNEHLASQAKYGYPIEDAEPLLPWEVMQKEMVIQPMERT